ncbi:hypothetical protein [Snodgrassella communis]|uniref:hypothetical protein n=1 Tax=Snodgrassella communis TaxID=2946699 RepID=UPI001EF503A3|nr:hypothetical protein [Snodgrassella communis]
MKFDLIIEKPLTKLTDFKFELYDKDSLTEALSIIEDAIYETHKIKFYFNSLGEVWNVTVFGDLSVFLEQLDDILKVTKGIKKQHILDFYEVGTNRKLLLILDKKIVEIKNISTTGWKPSITAETQDDLDNQILFFVKKLKGIIEIICPEVNQIAIIKKWYNLFQ